MSDTSAESWIGKTVGGRYLIEKKLGAGAMGAVFIANQISMDRKVALKLLHANLQGSESLVKRFEREMKATSKVDHQNTVRVYDFGETDEGKLFLAMELVKGDSLRGVIEKTGVFETIRALKIAIQIGKALNAAHSEGIVHRDLKPDNIMLVDRYGEQDFVKVLDFGIARFVDETSTQLTSDGQVVGTPLYIAPEQAQGQTVDHRADLYALGVILYQLVVGKVPFKSETLVGLLLMHAQEPPPPPSEVVPGQVPQHVEAAILRLMEKDPGARPQSATEVVELLERCSSAVGPGSAHSNAAGMPARTVANPGKQLKGQGSTVGMGMRPAPKGIGTAIDNSAGASGGSSKGLLITLVALLLIGGTVAGLAAAGVFGADKPAAAPIAAATDETASDIGKAGEQAVGADAVETEPEAPDAGSSGGSPTGPSTGAAGSRAQGVVDAGSKASPTPDSGEASPKADASSATQRPDVKPTSRIDPAVVRGLRSQLEQAQKRMGDPPAPLRCQTKEADVLSVLVRVAGFLQSAALDSNTTLDKLAFQQLGSVKAKGEASPEFWALMALAQLATEGDAAVATGPLNAARTVALCGEWAVGHRLLGNAAYRNKDYGRAVTAYQRTLALLPDYPKVAINLAKAQLKAKEHEAAAGTATKILVGSPGEIEALEVRYEAFFHLKKWAEAERDLMALVAKVTDNGLLWHNLGGTRMMQKKANATEAFCKAKALGHAPAARYCEPRPAAP